LVAGREIDDAQTPDCEADVTSLMESGAIRTPVLDRARHQFQHLCGWPAWAAHSGYSAHGSSTQNMRLL
jgi:hypothetical protein